MLYKRELKKIIILFVIGLILSIAFFIAAITNYSGSTIRLGTNDYLILLMILCYPVGIVYGWRQILNLYNNMRRSDREHWANGGGRGNTALMITTFNLAFSVIITLLVGWIIGLINAYKKLKQLKSIDY
jgi:hypothetical protein